MFVPIDIEPLFDCFDDQCANIIAEGDIHLYLFVLINIALMICPSLLLSISCTRNKRAKLEHTKHKKEREDSKENGEDGEEQGKNCSKTKTEQLPTTTEDKKDSTETGGLVIAREDRKGDNDYKIELNEPPRKTSRRTKPQNRKRTKTKTKPLNAKDYESGNVKHIRSKMGAAQRDTLSYNEHTKRKKHRDEDGHMDRSLRKSQAAVKTAMFEDDEKQKGHRRRESLGRHRSLHKKLYAPDGAEFKDDFNRERRKYHKDGKGKSKHRLKSEGRNEGKAHRYERRNLQTSTAYDDFVRSGKKRRPKSTSIDHFDNSNQPWESCEQLPGELARPTDQLRDRESRSTANEIDRKVRPRRFEMGEKEMQIARGSRAGRHEYKTMDDILSDWGSDRSIHSKHSNMGRSKSKLLQASVGQYKLETKRPGQSSSHYRNRFPEEAIKVSNKQRSSAATKLPSSKQMNYKDGKQSNGDGIEQWNSLGDNMGTDILHSISTQSETEKGKIGSEIYYHDRAPPTIRTERTQHSHLRPP